jgi:hypothetical protein
LTGKRIIQAFDKQAKTEVDKAVEEAKASPVPWSEDLWTDIYYKGTEPAIMRGRERDEVRRVDLNREADPAPEQRADRHFTGSRLLIGRIKKAGPQRPC